MNQITIEEIDEILSAVHKAASKEVVTDLLLDLRLKLNKD
jgi:hypothetical protein